MKYLMLVCVGPDSTPDRAPKDVRETTEAWVAEVDGRGIRIMGERVRPAGDATTVRVRDGETLITDGPFTETREQIAGFDILDCKDLDEAIEVAAKHPMASFGMIDIRPFWQ
jgi:hypothetical protein